MERPIKINIRQVIDERLPRYRRFIPRWAVAWLERTVHQDDLNALLASNAGKRGADFASGVLADLDVTYTAHGLDAVRDHRRPLIVCNHPLGGLDGLMMIDLVARTWGRNLHFVVNDLLMAVEPLRDVFLPVNKHGRQSRDDMARLEEAFAGDDPVIMFPAGLVSRRLSKGVIADLKWNKMFVAKAIESRRDVIPVYFSGRNSSFFYNFAHWRERLGLKFNIEMVYLPGEVFKCRGRHFDIYFGRPVAWQSLADGRDMAATAARIRQIVYSLGQGS